MYKVAFPEKYLDKMIEIIQGNLKADKPYYAYFYRGNVVVGIFKDKIFRMSRDKRT